jgi:hypothetical protein
MIFDRQRSITELEYRQAGESGLEPAFELPCSDLRLGGDSDAPRTGLKAKENSYSIELLETVSANCREATTNYG